MIIFSLKKSFVFICTSLDSLEICYISNNGWKRLEEVSVERETGGSGKGKRVMRYWKERWKARSNILKDFSSTKVLRNSFTNVCNVCYGKTEHIAELDVDFMGRFIERGAATEPLLAVDFEISLAMNFLVFISLILSLPNTITLERLEHRGLRDPKKLG